MALRPRFQRKRYQTLQTGDQTTTLQVKRAALQ